MKLFIVDDSSPMCERLKTLFSGFEGIEVAGQAQNAQEAIDSILKIKPDVVTLDIRIHGGSGIDALKKIKVDKSSPIVIILTNYPYPEYKKKCIQAGADYFFDKSTEFENAVQVLQQLVLHSMVNNLLYETGFSQSGESSSMIKNNQHNTDIDK